MKVLTITIRGITEIYQKTFENLASNQWQIEDNLLSVRLTDGYEDSVIYQFPLYNILEIKEHYVEVGE